LYRAAVEGFQVLAAVAVWPRTAVSRPVTRTGPATTRRSTVWATAGAFDAPWQSTVFALATAVIEHAFGGDREPFRQQLIAAIAAQPGRPCWESWTAALDALVQALPDQPMP
jgi:hypothetical protein